MHTAAFAALGLDGTYSAIRCGADEVPVLMRRLADAGGGGNVTVPHKAAAADALDRASALVGELGACNTFWAENGALVGDNTDVPGIVAAVGELDVPAGGWMIAGTGGSARAAVGAARRLGAPVWVRSREAGRAEQFLAWARSIGAECALADDCVLCINATPLGLDAEDGDPLPLALAPSAVAALDLVYRRGRTLWVHEARRRGLRAEDGRTVLVGQGTAAFERWWPGVQAPVSVMRQVVDAELG